MPCGEEDEECETKAFHGKGVRKVAGCFSSERGWGRRREAGHGRGVNGTMKLKQWKAGGRLRRERHGQDAIHRRQMSFLEERVSALGSTLQQGLARLQLYSRRPHRGLFTEKHAFAPWWGGPLYQYVLHGSGRDAGGHGEHVALGGTSEIFY